MKSYFNYSAKQKEVLETAEANILKNLSELAFRLYMLKNKNVICL